MEDKLLAVEILKMVRSIDKKLDDTAKTLSTHMTTEEQDWTNMHTKLDSLTQGFPNGDTQGHAAYHSSIIEIMEDRKAFWKKMRDAAAQWGLIGVLGWLAVIVWQAFLQGPHK